MTRPIDFELLQELNKDSFMLRCCLCGKFPPQWHHALNYGGQQINSKYFIVPLCVSCHSREKEKDINEKISWIVLSRTPDEELQKYSKIINYIEKKKRLIEKYGLWHHN